jgi:hypothetical protein
MLRIALLMSAACLTSCMAATGPEPQINPQSQMRLQQMLAGRAAGPVVSCLPPGQSSDMTVLDGGTVVFRSGNTLYVNGMRGGCPNLRSHYALLTRQFGGSGLCSGQIAEVVDPSTGISITNCSFGEFVPYRRIGN